MRSGLPSALICPNSKSYFHLIRRAAVVSGCPFFRSAASFSQQIPKLICERSCRMAKTLTVNITPNLKKESRKRKKNKKKIYFFAISLKNTRKKLFPSGKFFLKQGRQPVQIKKEQSFMCIHVGFSKNELHFNRTQIKLSRNCLFCMRV